LCSRQVRLCMFTWYDWVILLQVGRFMSSRDLAEQTPRVHHNEKKRKAQKYYSRISLICCILELKELIVRRKSALNHNIGFGYHSFSLNAGNRPICWRRVPVVHDEFMADFLINADSDRIARFVFLVEMTTTLGLAIRLQCLQFPMFELRIIINAFFKMAAPLESNANS